MTKVVLDPGGPNELTLDETNLIRDNPILTHTGKGDFRAAYAGNITKVQPYAQRQDRFNLVINGNVEFTGYLKGLRGNRGNAEVTLVGDGIGKKLEETRPDYDSLGGSLSYSSIAVQDAIRDYWARTPFDNFTVTDQTTELVAENEEVQSADTNSEWNTEFSPADDVPLRINNGFLEDTQICWTQEGENADDLTTGLNPPTDTGKFSGGDVAHISADGDFAEWRFTPNHDIPSEDVGINVRDGVDDPDGTPELEWRLRESGQSAGSGNLMAGLVVGSGIVFNWSDLADAPYPNGDGYDGPDLEAGTEYVLRLECTDDGGTLDQYQYYVDVVAPFDTRYESDLNFDGSNDGSGGYLDGPELYPDNVSIEGAEQPVSFNVTSATANLSINDTSNNQSVGISNDGGTTYQTENNTSNPTVNFPDAGRIARIQFTLSRYGSRTTATPQTGFNNQRIDSFSLTVDGNNLAVIDELDLSRSHFSNLKTLHSAGNFLWVIEHDGGSIEDMSVNSFMEGEVTKPSPDSYSDPININPEIAGKNYYNSIYIQGALDENGDRPTAEVKDDDAIAEDNREISPGVLRDQKITTEAGAIFRARSLLESAQDNKNLVGGVTIPPTVISPGFAREIDLGQGLEYKTVEEVRLSESSGSVQSQHRFTLPDDLAEDITSLKSDTGTLGDKL